MPSAAAAAVPGLQRPGPGVPAGPGQQRPDDHPGHARGAELRARRAVHAGRLRDLRGDCRRPARSCWRCWPARPFMLLVGVVMERVLVRLFYHRPPEDQILVTFGAGIVLVEGGARAVRRQQPARAGAGLGRRRHPARLPDLSDLSAGADRHHRGDPGRLLWLVLYRTSIGLVVRAGIEDARHGRHPRHQRAAARSCWCSRSAWWRRASPGMLYAPIVSVDAGHGRRVSWWNPSW